MHCVPLLRLASLRVAYSGRCVLDIGNVVLDSGGAGAGFLLGANGAGKTTLLNAISGYATSNGCTFLDTDGCVVRIDRLRPHAVLRAGVARTFQHPIATSMLTVWESVALASSIYAGTLWSPLSSSIRPAITPIFEALELSEVRDVPLLNLPLKWVRRVELARVLTSEPGVLLLDEPTAGADDVERAALTAFLGNTLPALVAELRARNAYRFPACNVWVITHDIQFAQAVCAAGDVRSPALVLDAGKVLREGSLEQVLRDPTVIDAWIGGMDGDVLDF